LASLGLFPQACLTVEEVALSATAPRPGDGARIIGREVAAKILVGI